MLLLVPLLAPALAVCPRLASSSQFGFHHLLYFLRKDCNESMYESMFSLGENIFLESETSIIKHRSYRPIEMEE